jgi:hypothetical protein
MNREETVIVLEYHVQACLQAQRLFFVIEERFR